MDAARHNEQVQAQFGAAAENYVASATHAAGDDLEQLVEWSEGGPDRMALDVATGGGHTALALASRYGKVVASDLTDRMLVTAEAFIRGRGVRNVEFRRADAADLPFADVSFDTVSCRIAPHHFADVDGFVAEVSRVLKPGGIFLLEDSVAPADPEVASFLNRAESLRDPTHVRSLQVAEWHQLLDETGLVVEAERLFPKAHPFGNWLDLARTPETSRALLADLFRDAPAAARSTLEIVIAPNGQIESYTDEKIVLKARKA